MNHETTRHIVRDEVKQFMLDKCRLNQSNTVKDTRVLIYTILFIVILLSIVVVWWLDWVTEKYWWIKLIMTFLFIAMLIWLGLNYKSMK
jgi:NADH:ubiquinone oxidoreductase subunit 3 (subunit A)